MSQMKALYEKVAGDAELQAKFIAILQTAEEDGFAVTEQKLVALSKDAGYEVGLAEMQQFLKEVTPNPDGELSDMELDMVAGGKGEGAAMAGAGGAMSIALAVATFGIMLAGCIPQIVGGVVLENTLNTINNLNFR